MRPSPLKTNDSVDYRGGIAAYKALETARQMQRLGLDVTGVMTKSAAIYHAIKRCRADQPEML